MPYDPNQDMYNFDSKTSNSQHRWSYEDYEAASFSNRRGKKNPLSIVLWSVVILVVVLVLSHRRCSG